MAKKVKYKVTFSSLEEFVEMVDLIEANQRNAESGTTDCSSRQDAELSNENRAFQPEGNPLDFIEEFESWLEQQVARNTLDGERISSLRYRTKFGVLSGVLGKWRAMRRSQGGC